MVRARLNPVLALALAGSGACDRILNLPERSYGPDAEAPGTGESSAGERTPDSGSGSAPAPVDSMYYSFESDTQGWESCGERVAGVTVSSSKVYAGERSLSVNLQADAGGLRCQGAQDPERMQFVYIRSPPISPGKIVTFHVWIPAMSSIVSIQPYILTEDGRWEGDYRLTSNLATSAWNEFKVRYPSNAAPLEQLGVEIVINPSPSWSGTCYIDMVGW